MKKIMVCLIASLSLGFVASSAYASNYSYLNETPVKYFDDQDWSLVNAAQQKALDRTPDNTKVSWKNPDKKHSGYFIPMHTSHDHGMTCRTLQIFMDADGLTTLVKFRYCKIKGKWEITR